MSEKHIGFDSGSDDQTVVSLFDGRNMSIIYPPEWAGKIVATTVFNGALIVSCEKGVFRERGGNLYPMRFCDHSTPAEEKPTRFQEFWSIGFEDT